MEVKDTWYTNCHLTLCNPGCEALPRALGTCKDPLSSRLDVQVARVHRSGRGGSKHHPVLHTRNSEERCEFPAYDLCWEDCCSKDLAIIAEEQGRQGIGSVNKMYILKGACFKV